jgi:sialic acid synthase SpsE/sugar phosphate isomerase/epimerase
MIIDRDITPHIVFAEDSLLVALNKISANKTGAVMAVSETGRLVAVLTDGDIRRWLIEQEGIDLNVSIFQVANRQFAFAYIDDDPEYIRSLFSARIHFVPLLDKAGHLVAIAHDREAEIIIGKHRVGKDAPALVIAEIGNNHNGSLELAKRLVDLAHEAGADVAKFQMRDMDSLYTNQGDAADCSEDLGSQYILDLLSRNQLSTEQMLEVFDYCRELGIVPLCTPWDERSVEVLEGYGISAYKIASADLTNHQLIRRVAATGKPLLISTGMAEETEIRETVVLLREMGVPFVMLHCNSTYPAPFKDVNLNYLSRLKRIGDCDVGYSGHERGYAAVLGAIALGAKVIEKHFTVDRTMEGNDHRVSLLPNEFSNMVRAVRELEQAMGSDGARQITQGELMNRENLAKSIVCSRDIRAGDVLEENMLAVRSPGQGLQPNRLSELLGRKAVRDMLTGQVFFESDLGNTRSQPRDYRFNRPWGIPVRYHDAREILDMTNPDLLEFHLSYKDLEESLSDHLDAEYDLAVVVHSPELFAGDHVLDLCSEDEEYRRRSIEEMQHVVEVARKIGARFHRTQRPCIVTNVGGFTQDRPLIEREMVSLRERLLDSLAAIDANGVEIIPQTMPPFPWHFGGQRYHNLFIRPEEIASFCRENGYRICLDVSHSKLACTQFGISFSDFVNDVGPYVAHLHLADARGVDGEGLQIGEGEIDFRDLARQLDAVSPEASFIPEIWQGHTNSGEGFWKALDILENCWNLRE